MIIDASLKKFEYIHPSGDQSRVVSFTILDHDSETKSIETTLLDDIHNGHISNQTLIFDWLMTHVKANQPIYPLNQLIKDFLVYSNIDENELILNIFTSLDLSHPNDLVTYLKICHNIKVTLFEQLDVKRTHYGHQELTFSNPAKSMQYKFGNAVVPTWSTNYGGSYFINLYELPYGASNKASKLIKKFDNNLDVYDYIINHQLTIDN